MTQHTQRNIKLKKDDELANPSQTAGYVIYFITGVIEFLLAFRLIFKLTGANPDSDFVATIYGVSGVLISPFGGIFRSATTQGVETTAVFEPANLVAIVSYAVLAWVIAQIVVIMSGRQQ